MKMNELDKLHNQVATMSSVELVSIINKLRVEGQAELLHKSFLTKVVKVLGDVVAQNFLLY
jgi:hypothetical protein